MMAECVTGNGRGGRRKKKRAITDVGKGGESTLFLTFEFHILIKM